MSLLTADRRELLLWFSLTAIVAVAMIWMRTATIKETYVFVQHERELRTLQQEIQAARVRWLTMTSPKKLEATATRLGLVPPKTEQILRYEPENTSQNAIP